MKVKDVMTASVSTCVGQDTLANAARLMWDKDCGILPVVSEDEKVIGLITDRDICMAAALTGRPLADIEVREVISGTVLACKPQDEVREALSTMKQNRVRRLPVISADAKLEGMVSMNDLVLKAEEAKDKKTPGLSYKDVITTYKAICEHRVPVQRVQAATGA